MTSQEEKPEKNAWKRGHTKSPIVGKNTDDGEKNIREKENIQRCPTVRKISKGENKNQMCEKEVIQRCRTIGEGKRRKFPIYS